MTIPFEIVKLYFVDHSCEHTPYESLSEAQAVAENCNTSVHDCYFIRVLEDVDGEMVPRYFRLGAVGQDDWYYHPK